MKKRLTNRSNRKRSRRQGFLRRMRTRGGRETLNRRRRKGRWQLVSA